MPSSAERVRNDLRTGIFVLVSVGLAVATMIFISGRWSDLVSRRQTYSVRFPVRTGVANLKSGADVRVGGIAMGRVLEVVPEFEEHRIRVDFEVDHRAVLRPDARVLVGRSLIGSDAWLEVTDLGRTEGTATELTGGGSGGALASLLGDDGEQVVDDLEATVAHARAVAAKADDAFGRYDERITTILDETHGAVADVRQVTDDLATTRWPTWADGVGDAIARIDGTMNQVDAAIADGRALIGDGRAILEKGGPEIEAILVNLDAASVDVRSMTDEARQEILPAAERIVARVEETVNGVATDAVRWRLDLGETLAHATLGARRLRIAVEEVKHAPWKLLHRPTASELDHELLYAAAQSFSLAASDLRLTSEATRRLMDDHAAQIDEDEELARRVREELSDALERFAAAEERLIRALFDEEVGGGAP